MKKILLIMMAAMATLTAKAETKEFTDQLVVSVNDVVSTQQTTVNVEMLEDDYINFKLKNFVLLDEESGDEMYVGNIEVNNLFLSDKVSYKTFSYNANLKIKDGDREDVDMWIGPELGNVPLVMNGKLSDGKLYVSIDIDMMSSLGQTIYVKFGSDFDAPGVTASDTIKGTVTSIVEMTDGGGNEIIAPMDDVENYEAIVQSLTTGNVNLILNNVQLSSGGESVPLGNLTLTDVEALNRGTYYDLSWSGTAVFEDGVGAGAPFPALLKGKFDGENLYYNLTVGESELWSAVYTYTFATDFAPLTPAAASKTYSDQLVVSVDAESTDPMDAKVQVTPLTNGGINFALKNFTMILGGNEMHVGNIEVADLKIYQGQGYQYFNYDGSLVIAAGDEEGVEEDEYVGPMLGEIPLRMRGRMTDERLYVVIDIEMEVGGEMQVIHVDFGNQIANAIAAIVSEKIADGRVYDLAGRRVRQPKNGIFVVNGRKTVIR
ncbi:MAG: hypothetical protein IJ762_05480 [Bacteroidaceae bacterium]|nr:hypothetical protein [Bacteroidaceae bacterium]